MSNGLLRFISSRISTGGKRQRFFKVTKFAAVFSIVLGTIALILSIAILEGFNKELKEKAVRFTADISLRSFNRDSLPDYTNTIAKLKAEYKEISAIQPIIEREALVRANNNVEGVLVRGISGDVDITGIRRYLTAGSFSFSSAVADEIVIGQRLAQKLGVEIGDLLTVYYVSAQSITEFADPSIRQFKVIGTYRSGMQLYDDILLFIPFEKASEFFEMPSNNVTSYEIMLSDKSRIAELALEIEDFLGYPHYALTVYDLHRSIFLWIELQQEPIPIVLGLITIVAVLNIITTLLITVVEKTHTIGILRTLGLSRRKVLGIFLYRGFKIGLTGTIIGSTIGYGFCIIQQKYEIIKLQGDIYFLDALPVHFDVLHLLLIASLTLVFSVLASMFPALAALKITPLKAIRFK